MISDGEIPPSTKIMIIGCFPLSLFGWRNGTDEENLLKLPALSLNMDSWVWLTFLFFWDNSKLLFLLWFCLSSLKCRSISVSSPLERNNYFLPCISALVKEKSSFIFLYCETWLFSQAFWSESSEKYMIFERSEKITFFTRFWPKCAGEKSRFTEK